MTDNSHMDLTNAGFTNEDVKELRFFCTEKMKYEKIYWHFKTSNHEFIRTAMTGDTSLLKVLISFNL